MPTRPTARTHQIAQQLVGEWLQTFPDHDRTARKQHVITSYSAAIGYPFTPTGAARDVSSLKGGLTWLNWCQVHDVDPLHAPRADVETWWNDINTATSLGTSTRLLMVRAMSSWNLWTVREKHANVAYGAWVDQIGTVK